MPVRANNTLRRLDYLDNEIAQVKLELIRETGDRREDESKLTNRIVKEVRAIRSRLYKERYGGKAKAARVS